MLVVWYALWIILNYDCVFNSMVHQSCVLFSFKSVALAVCYTLCIILSYSCALAIWSCFWVVSSHCRGDQSEIKVRSSAVSEPNEDVCRFTEDILKAAISLLICRLFLL